MTKEALRQTRDALEEAQAALNGAPNTQGLHSQIDAALRAAHFELSPTNNAPGSAGQNGALGDDIAKFDRLLRLQTAAPDLLEALRPLARIADAYDANQLDDEARKFCGIHLEHGNDTPPEHIELYKGRGGKRLLTLADCFAARAAVAKAEGADA